MLLRSLVLLVALLPDTAAAQSSAGEVLTFPAIADTYVDAGSPTAKFGGSPVLKVDGTPIRIIYLRFAVAGLHGRPVQQARLRLGVAGASPQSGGTVHRITSTSWDEATLTYATRPPVNGPGLATLGPLTTVGAIVEVPLDGAILGDGIHELAIDSTSSSSASYYSTTSPSGSPPTLVLTVTNGPAPTVVIAQPPAGSTFFVGDAVTFTGIATDATDGDLGPLIAWRSDLDGDLGTGASITTALHEGHHIVTAQVTNHAGVEATARAEVAVIAPPTANTEPLVAISAPLDGQTLVAGQPIRFAGTAHDLEDGELTGTLAWTSDRDGPLGTGGVISHALGLGTHRITAQVVDRMGLSGSASATLAVVPPDTVALLPVADASVDAGAPSTNAGASPLLRVDASPVRVAYLRFLVQGLAGQRVASAHLHLQADSATAAASASGGTLHTITSHAWQEATVTYANRPRVDGPAIAVVGPVTAGQAVDLDLGAAIPADGPYDLALVADSSDEADYRTRETTTPPTLTLTLAGRAPTVTIVAPASGAVVVAGDPVTLTATATDPEDGSLAGRIRWDSSLDGALGTGGSIRTTALRIGTHTVTATVTDGDGRSSSAAITLRVRAGNQPPLITITTPAAGAHAFTDAPVTLTAVVSDDEDTDLAARVEWTSSRDGALGAGASRTAVLSAGTHTLTASVTDSGGLVARAQRTLVVRPPNVAPVVVIRAPTDGAALLAGKPALLAAAATDAEDGDLGPAIRWTSSRDGALGTGATFTTTLSVGAHVLTAAVTDADGGTTSARVSITIAPATLSFVTVADTYVDAGSPSGKFGTATGLLVGASPVRQAFLRFAVQGIAPFTVERAFLRLTVGTGSSDGSAQGGAVHRITNNTWSEGATTYTSRPPIDGPGLATRARVVAKQVVDFDVTGALGADGTYNFALDSASTDPVRYQSREASAKPQLVVSLRQNQTPVVTIVAPARGTAVNPGTAVTFAGRAVDAESGDLGASLAWTSDQDGPLGTGATLVVTTLRPGTHTITARVTDADGMSGEARTTVVVRRPPVVTITSPADGEVRFTSQLPMRLAATAVDEEGHDLAAGLVWTSSLDGTLGSGREIVTASLRIGTHLVTASVTDAHGVTGRAKVTLRVRGPNARPTVTIGVLGPRTVPAGTPVTLTATATDEFDGDLSARIQWASNRDGPLGAGAACTAVLSEGRHILTAMATDSDGASASAQTTVTVTPTPPVVSITAPSATTVQLGASVTFAATAQDATDGDLAALLRWTSDRDGPIGTGASVTTAALSAGTHIVTATAIDTGGLTSQAARTLLVNQPPALTIATPLDGASLLAGKPVQLAARALDPEDGDLGAALQWTSSREGALGTGPRIITAGLSPGTHVLTAAVADRNGGAASASVTVTLVSPTLRFTPVADTYVDAGHATTTNGTRTSLVAGSSPVRQALLRFAVSGVAPFAVDRALLHLTVGAASADGTKTSPTVSALAAHTWPEATTTYATRPALDGALVATLGKLIPKQLVEADVSPAVHGDGPLDLTLACLSTDSVVVASREATAGKPDLVVTLRQRTPAVTILAPEPDALMLDTTPVTFFATAFDEVDGELGATLVWTSDRDGVIGHGVTFTTDALSVGAHTVTATAVNGAGIVGTASVPFVVHDAVLAFTPTADTYVDQAFPTTNFGAAARLAVGGGGSIKNTFLRFLVTGIGALQVADARLELMVGPIDTASGGTGGTLRRITSNTWSEATMTYANQPAVTGAVLDSIPLPVVQGDQVSFRVGAAVTRDDTYNFALTSTSRDAAKYQSREGLPPPRLLVTLRQPALRAPQVTITTPPAPETVVYDDEPIRLVATALDTRDGLLTSAITWQSNLDGSLGSGGAITVPRFRRGTRIVTAKVHNRAGMTGAAAVIVRVLDRPPAVVIQSPADGQLFPIGFPIVFTATATDDGTMDLSPAITWTSDHDGTLGSGPVLSTTGLSAGDHRITATVTNGVGTVGSAALTVTIANSAPRLAITAPLEGATVAEGGAVMLDATASDIEDGDLTSALTWTSSVQGPLGTGGTIAPVLLTVGTHVLTATVTDSGGLGSSAQVAVQVVKAPPTLMILSPADGSSIAGPLTLTGQAYDLHAGDRSAAIQWTSSVAGTLGRGASVTVPRPPFGRHVITARVTNGDGLVTTRSITVVVGNIPPRVTITAPANGATVPHGVPVTLEGAASDASDGDLAANLRWFSDLDGPLATGATVTVPRLSQGTHRITARVADLRGLTGAAEMLLAVTSGRGTLLPRVTITAPTRDLTVVAGSPVTFAGTAVAGDADLGASLVWVSDLDGVLATGTTFATRTLSPGTHRITALARERNGPVGTAAVQVTVTIALSTFPAIADASTDEQAPAANLGSAPTLLVDNNPVRRIFLRFAVTALPEGPIERAVVRLRTTGATAAGSDLGGEIRTVSGPWDELAVTHLTKPAMDGALLASVATVEPAQTVDFDVTAAIAGEGFYNFGVKTRSTNGVEYVAREGGASGPALLVFPARPVVTSPRVDITTPAGGLALPAGVPTSFTATATDPQDGDIATTLLWRSDRDGLLGTGSQLTATLSPGVHLITATATDAAGNTAADLAEVAVGSTGPRVTIDRPTSGTSVPVGEPLAFLGTAFGNGDGDLAASLTWTSSIDGPLGTGPSLVRTLTPGTHTVTATVTDRVGNQASATVRVQVTGDRVGFEDFGFGPNIEVGLDKATATKPQSKLWYQDGIWWASLFVQSKSAYHIHRLDVATQTWVDTGVLVDGRGRSRQDVLLDGQTLYMVSRFGFAGAVPPVNRLLRFTYYPGAQTYTLDPGFPVTIPGGGAEAVTLAKDASGTLWIAYMLEGTLFVSHTLDGDGQWSQPFTPPLPEGTLAQPDDDAAVITMADGAIGIFWSNQLTDKFYFATHPAATLDQDPLAWRQEVVASGSSVADDHFNLKLAADGRLFVAAKTSRQTPGATLVGLFVRTPAGTWSPLYKVATAELNPTRPICVLDETRRRVFVVYSSNQSDIYYKASDMNAIAFAGGLGTPLMVSGTHPDPILVGGLNDPTSTKQNLDPSAGLLVVASTSETNRYWHNWLALPIPPPTVAITTPMDGLRIPVGTPMTFTATATSPTDGVITSRLAWTSSRDGALGVGASITTAGLSLGTHTITAAARDETTLTGQATITISVVPNQAPVVMITRPADGGRVRADQPVTFTGMARDTFDGDRSTTLTWTSDRDGFLGSGGSFTHPPLAAGRHTITAEVTDDAGRVGGASITVDVLDPSPPTAMLLAPADGTVVAFGAPLSFAATAADPFDGDLTARLAWSSSRDGAIGTGASFARSTLSLGTHVITVTARDSVGLTASASVTVVVTSTPPPSP